MDRHLTNEQLLDLVDHQLRANWGGLVTLEKDDIHAIGVALQRLEKCFEKNRSPYFWERGGVIFRVEHTVQYAIFLYILSNELYKTGKTEKASFVYYLNKLMNSVEWFYAVSLPEHFGAEHPLGSVLGRAVYGDYFFVYQGVTVGGNWRGEKIHYPVIGEHVTMFSDSKVIGDSHIGDHTVIAANTYIKDTDIPDGSVVYGRYPNLVIKQADDKIREMAGRIWLT